jgi:hypothetical protein
MPLVAPHERAGVLSIIYALSYLALGGPAVLAGLLVVHGRGVLATGREYSLAVIVLAALALLGQTVLGQRRAPAAETTTPRRPRSAPQADPCCA